MLRLSRLLWTRTISISSISSSSLWQWTTYNVCLVIRKTFMSKRKPKDFLYLSFQELFFSVCTLPTFTHKQTKNIRCQFLLTGKMLCVLPLLFKCSPHISLLCRQSCANRTRCVPCHGIWNITLPCPPLSLMLELT